MLLYCNNVKIAAFRTKMTNLIEARLKHFFHELLIQTTPLNISKILHEISNIYCALQQQQQGRLESIPIIFNNRYVEIKELMQKFNLDNIIQGVWKSKSFFLSELMGLLPEESSFKLSDSNIGTVDLPWLGLIPKVINEFIMQSIKNAKSFIVDKSIAQEWYTDVVNEWKEITSIIMGKAAGLHNISGSITRELEKKYSYDEKLESKESTTNNGTQHNSTKATPPIGQVSKKKRTIDKMETKKCISVSCGPAHKTWMRGKSFNTNHIPISHKQCQRCANYSTAMKATIETFEHIVESKEDIGNKAFDKIRKYQTTGRIKYNSLMNMLHEYYPSIEYFSKARFISKSRLSEKSKKNCHIIINTVQHFALLQETSFENLVQHMIKHIQSTLSQITSQATKDRQTLKRLRLTSSNNISSCSRKLHSPSPQHLAKPPPCEQENLPDSSIIDLCNEEDESLPSSPKPPKSIISDFNIVKDPLVSS